MALSRQRDTTICASLIRQGNLWPAGRTKVPLQSTAERWLCPANKRDKSTGATVVVQQWAAVCKLLLCPVNGKCFFLLEPSFYMPPCPENQNFPSKADFYYFSIVTPSGWTYEQICGLWITDPQVPPYPDTHAGPQPNPHRAASGAHGDLVPQERKHLQVTTPTAPAAPPVWWVGTKPDPRPERIPRRARPWADQPAPLVNTRGTAF